MTSGTWYHEREQQNKFMRRPLTAAIFSLDPFLVYCLAHPTHYICNMHVSFSLPRCYSDPGSLSRLVSPLPTTMRAFVFIASTLQPFLPSSTRVELCLLPRRYKALSVVGVSRTEISIPKFEPLASPLVVFEVNHY